MRINVRKIIDMWNNKNYSSEERSKDFNAILKYYDRIINYTDLGILTINIYTRCLLNAKIFYKI